MNLKKIVGESVGDIGVLLNAVLEEMKEQTQLLREINGKIKTSPAKNP